MSAFETALLVAGVFLSAAAVDYTHARYALARDAGRAHAAALWSVVQWIAASVGFVVVVKVSLWMLPAEGAGLYAGSYLAISRGRGTSRSRFSAG